jgi:hypothetical protein
MSNNRAIVTLEYPATPKGTRIEIEIPESYDADLVAEYANEAAIVLRRGTPFGRLLTFLKLLFGR